MLVTHRRTGESLLIGDNIEIKVLEIGSGFVRIGVAAPREVPVLRMEMKLTAEENRTAAQSVTGGALEALVRQMSGTHRQGAKTLSPKNEFKDREVGSI